MDDLISREQAIDAIEKKSDEIYKTKQDGATFPHDDLFQGMAYAADIIKALPSAQPEQRTGKWIHISEETWKCDQCGEISCCSPKYCPDCGSRNEVTT